MTITSHSQHPAFGKARAAAVLEEAAQLIDTEGWWDGRESNFSARNRCAVMAITAASSALVPHLDWPSDADFFDSPAWQLNMEAQSELARFLGLESKDMIPLWNDGADRQVVTDTLRTVAMGLRVAL